MSLYYGYEMVSMGGRGRNVVRNGVVLGRVYGIEVGYGCLVIIVQNSTLFDDLADPVNSIIGLVVEYMVAIHVTRVRFPDDALFSSLILPATIS
jgi:hypothetical protein